MNNRVAEAHGEKWPKDSWPNASKVANFGKRTVAGEVSLRRKGWLIAAALELPFSYRFVRRHRLLHLQGSLQRAAY